MYSLSNLAILARQQYANYNKDEATLCILHGEVRQGGKWTRPEICGTVIGTCPQS